jgi:hypothetical protein
LIAAMIKYVSLFDSPEDPQGIIKQSLDMGADFPGPAPDVFLAWTLRLGLNADVAAAAAKLAEDYGLRKKPPIAGEHGKLVALLLEAAEGRQITPRRRGGARRRRSLE